MRRVKIKRHTWENGIWSDGEGKFHQWGIITEYVDEGLAVNTIAIVECADGSIAEVKPGDLQFIDEVLNPRLN